MSGPKNEKVVTTIETNVTVTGRGAVEATTKAVQGLASSLGQLNDRLNDIEETVKQRFSQNRTDANQSGQRLNRQRTTVRQDIPLPDELQKALGKRGGVEAQVVIQERLPIDARVDAEKRSLMRTFRSGLSAEALGTTGLYSQKSAGYQREEDLRALARSSDPFEAATAIPTLQLMQKNRRLLTRVAQGVGGEVEQRAYFKVRGLASRGRIEAAIVEAKVAADQQAVADEALRNEQKNVRLMREEERNQATFGSIRDRMAALQAVGVAPGAMKSVEKALAAAEAAHPTLAYPQIAAAKQSLEPLEEAASIFAKTNEQLQDFERRLGSLGKALDSTASSAIRAQLSAAQGVMPSTPVRGRTVSVGGVDVNKASYRDLLSIPGVSPSVAAGIVTYRQSIGGFNTPEEFLSKFDEVGQAQARVDAINVPSRPSYPTPPSRLPTGSNVIPLIMDLIKKSPLGSATGFDKTRVEALEKFLSSREGRFPVRSMETVLGMSPDDFMEAFPRIAADKGKTRGYVQSLVPTVQRLLKDELAGANNAFQAQVQTFNKDKAEYDKKSAEKAAATAQLEAAKKTAEQREGAPRSVQDLDEAAQKVQGSEDLIAREESRVREQTARLYSETKEMRASARRSELEKRFKTSPQGKDAVARMLAAEEGFKSATESGATLEAELRQAEMLKAQAELEGIEKEMNRGRYQRLSQVRALSHFAGGISSAASNIVSRDIRGIGQTSMAIPQAGFNLMRDLAVPGVVNNGLFSASGALFGAGLLGAGAFAVGQAAYGRGSAVLDRAAAGINETIPQFEAVFARNPELLSGASNREAVLAYMETVGHEDYADAATAAIMESSSMEEALSKARDRNAPSAISSGYDSTAKLIRDAYADASGPRGGLAERSRRRMIDRIFSEYGPGGTVFEGNVTDADVATALSASGGRGLGSEFVRTTGPQSQLPTDVRNAAALAAYANRRNLSVASVAQLSSLNPRFGITDTMGVHGLVGMNGFGFTAGARDDFTRQISGELMQAAMGGGTPEMVQRNRFFQGAVEAGGNKERMASAYARSINEMGDLRRGMFAGARGFGANLQLVKALSVGGSLEKANELLANEAPGFTAMDREREAYKAAPDLYRFEQLNAGMSAKDIQAKIASFTTGGAETKDEPETPESFMLKRVEALRKKGEAEVAKGTKEQADMASVAASFDVATAKFASAVDRFAYGIVR